MHRIGLLEVPDLVLLTSGTCCGSHCPIPVEELLALTLTTMRLSPDIRGVQSETGRSGFAQVPSFHQEYLAVPPCRGDFFFVF